MLSAPTLIWVLAVFRALHWLSVGVYVGSLLFLLFVFQKVYHRYHAYKYVDNFRGEIITLYWRYLHVAFILIIVSGAALTLGKGQSVLQGTYGFVFSSKLVLWLIQIYFTHETLKPFIVEVENSGLPQLNEPVRETSPVFIFLLLTLVAIFGFVLKFL